jgi:hypothetical protein
MEKSKGKKSPRNTRKRRKEEPIPPLNYEKIIESRPFYHIIKLLKRDRAGQDETHEKGKRGWEEGFSFLVFMI